MRQHQSVTHDDMTVLCSICGRPNSAEVVFCVGCVAPLRVQKLADLDSADLQLSLQNLLETLLGGWCAHGTVANPQGADELLRSYLTAFWLRPESALLQYAEARIVQEMLDQVWATPFLDIGCGNGVSTSLLLGWQFSDEVDVYYDLDLEAVDIYDALPQRALRAGIVKRGRPIGYGVDIKRSMVERAKLLGTFECVLQADAASLPLDKGEIGCVYSNVIRDFDDEMLEIVLSECALVLRPGGHLIISSPTEEYRDKLFYFPRAVRLEDQGNHDMADQYMRLDRGRSAFCQQQISLSDWERRLACAGFDLRETVTFAPKPMLELWDTGLRPFSPLLMSWVRALQHDGTFLPIKRAVVSALEALLYPYAAASRSQDGGFRVLLARRVQQ